MPRTSRFIYINFKKPTWWSCNAIAYSGRSLLGNVYIHIWEKMSRLFACLCFMTGWFPCNVLRVTKTILYSVEIPTEK